jgi:hypothetical protein
MQGTFFIASLPRSRTAWLANFLTFGDSFCYHEALKYCAAGELKKFFEATGSKFVGDSDSGLPFFIDDVMNQFPDGKLVVIERDPAPVVKSLERVFPDTGTDFREVVSKTQTALERLKTKYHPHVVPFDGLSDRDVCKKLWNYCLPGVPFDERRWKMLDLLTVEIQTDKYLADMPGDGARRMAQALAKFK